MTKLKSCPFCGEDPELQGKQTAHCETCGITLHIQRWNCQLGLHRHIRVIEQMREIMEAIAGIPRIPGKDWLWGQLALGEILDGKPGPHCEWALKMKAEYEATQAEQRPPCSHSCYHHISHPCEKCGRIQGRMPSKQPNTMKDALKWALTEAGSTHGEGLIKAALEAAERNNNEKI